MTSTLLLALVGVFMAPVIWVGFDGYGRRRNGDVGRCPAV